MWTLAFRSALVWMVWKLCCWAACRCCFASQPAWCRSIFQPPPGELGFGTSESRFLSFPAGKNGWRLLESVCRSRGRGKPNGETSWRCRNEMFGFTWLQGNTKKCPQRIVQGFSWSFLVTTEMVWYFLEKTSFFFSILHVAPWCCKH